MGIYQIKKLILTLIIILTLSSIVYSKSIGKGPLFTRNNYPPLLLFLQIPNDTALDIKKGEGYFETLISHSNVFSGEQTDQGDVLFDLEVTRFSNRGVYGITEDFIAGVEMPFLYLWRGLFDDSLQKSHKTFGLPNQNRDKAIDYSYWYLINKGKDQVSNRGEGVVGIGDISFFINYNISKCHNLSPCIGLTTALKIPSGDTELLHGSGKYDFGMGVTVKHPFGRFVIYSITGLVYPGKPIFLEEIEVKPFLSESASIEHICSTSLSFVIQLDFNSNPYSSGISKLDKESLELVLGFKRYIFDRFLWHFSFTENLTAETIVDYTIQTGMGIRF